MAEAKTTAKKTTRKKAAAPKKAATKKTAAKKATARKAEQPALEVTPDERRQYIAEAAYYRAERSGFRSNPEEDWLAAEAEIDAWLNAEAVH